MSKLSTRGPTSQTSPLEHQTSHLRIEDTGQKQLPDVPRNVSLQLSQSRPLVSQTLVSKDRVFKIKKEVEALRQVRIRHCGSRAWVDKFASPDLSRSLGVDGPLYRTRMFVFSSIWYRVMDLWERSEAFRINTPSSMMIVGPSGCGKTVFMTKLLVDNLDMFETPPRKIYYCYSAWQEGFRPLKKHGVKFHEGIPNLELLPVWFPKGGLLVLDDLMEEGGNNKRVLDLFTKHSHHQNVTVIYLCQDMFPPGKYAKSISQNACFTPETVQKVYELPFQIKHDFKITMFQYKIIHNILATKMSLFRAKISDNDVCPQCLAEVHSLNHIFLHCSSVIVFWKTFQNWWTIKTKEQLTLTNSMILHGVFDKTEHRYSLNYVLLIAKFHIYCSCLHDEKLLFDSFLILLKEKLNIQKEIAFKNKSITTFQKSFQNIF